MQETKMENIAAVKRLAVQKAYFYLSRNASHNQYILLPQSSPSGKKKNTRSLPLCHTCQLLMEILIATIKYFSRLVLKFIIIPAEAALESEP